MKIVCISDTHTYQYRMKHEIPSGDVLVHAGDFMSSGWDKSQYLPFLQWLSDQPHEHKILIAGNHDRYTQIEEVDFVKDVSAHKSITYLRDSETVINGIKFYGSPWQKWFWDWAWNFPSEWESYKRKAQLIWGNIPNDTNVLITHGQPYQINDRAPDGDDTGCKFLLERIKQLKELKLYVGGHIHCGYGQKEIDGVTFVNAAICDEDYFPINAPIVFNI